MNCILTKLNPGLRISDPEDKYHWHKHEDNPATNLHFVCGLNGRTESEKNILGKQEN